MRRNPFLYPAGLLQMGAVRDTSVSRSAALPRVEGGDPWDLPRWWLIHTKPRQEKKLAAQLRAFDIAHYLPATEWMATWRGRPRATIAPLFAGYLFLRGNAAQRRAALETNRIVATHPVADEVGIVRQLHDLADLIEKGVPLRLEERLVSGQYVRVKAGLLKDKCGIVIKRAGKTRLFVLVNELLGGVSLSVEQHLLEPYGGLTHRADD